jgi:hypothetical protein
MLIRKLNDEIDQAILDDKNNSVISIKELKNKIQKFG